MPGSNPAEAFARVKTLFDAVADLPDDGACLARLQELGADDELTGRVMALVQQERGELTHVSMPLDATSAPPSAPELFAGDRLGPWLLVSELGHGGMGQVFLAERADGLYEQDVAIKLLRNVASVEELEQLARERRILATLAHPHIARLFDGGTTPRGRPYLVMERVQGLRIDQWCERQQASQAQRLALFDQVCQAVGHAHSRLVVHCDIKPGNVLVGADARAMLLDFGIAQLQGRDGPTQVSLTPRYASPEQRAGESATTVSDIFSLGRLLGELLDAAPDGRHRRDEWQAVVARATAIDPKARYPSVDALQRELRRYDAHQPLAALPPSLGYLTRKLVRRRWPALLAVAALAGLSGSFVMRLVQERDRALQAEARAVAEQRNAQQARADALAQRDRATAAGDDAARERDRATAAGAEAALQRDAARQAEAAARADRQRAESARAEAQQRSATTAQVSDFLVSLFEGADPKRGGRPDTPVLNLVDTGRARVDSQLRDQPALQAEMKGVLAKVYDNVGRPADAVALYEEAIALERSPALRRPLREADLLSRQAVALANDDRHPQAVAPARRALALRAARLPADSLEMADAHNTLGWVLARNGEHDDARRHLERALQIRRQHKGASPLEVASTLHNLGLLEGRLDRLDAAETLFQQALDLKRRHLPPEHTTVLNTVQALAANFGQQQKFEQALPLLEQLVAARRALTGPDSSMTAGAEHELAVVQRDSGRTAEALENYRRSLQSKIRQSGPRSVNVAVTLNNIGGALEQLGDPAAEQSFRDSLAIRRERLPGNDISVARAEATLGRWLLRQARIDEARPLLAQAAATRAARLPPLHTDRLETLLLQAQLELADGRATDAERLLAQAPPDALRLSQRIEQLRLLARVNQVQHRPQEAVALLRQSLALHLQHIGPLHPDGALRHLDLADAQWAAGDRDGTARSLAAAQATLARHHAESPARARHAALLQRLKGD